MKMAKKNKRNGVMLKINVVGILPWDRLHPTFF